MYGGEERTNFILSEINDVHTYMRMYMYKCIYTCKVHCMFVNMAICMENYAHMYMCTYKCSTIVITGSGSCIPKV